LFRLFRLFRRRTERWEQAQQELPEDSKNALGTALADPRQQKRRIAQLRSCSALFRTDHKPGSGTE